MSFGARPQRSRSETSNDEDVGIEMNFIELPDNTPGFTSPVNNHFKIDSIAGVQFLDANTARVDFIPFPSGLGRRPVTVTEQAALVRIRQMVEDPTREWLRGVGSEVGERFILLGKVDRVLLTSFQPECDCYGRYRWTRRCKSVRILFRK
jgi:hypothetical protein